MGNSFRTWDAWALFIVPGSSLQLESRAASKERVEAPSLVPSGVSHRFAARTVFQKLLGKSTCAISSSSSVISLI